MTVTASGTAGTEIGSCTLSWCVPAPRTARGGPSGAGADSTCGASVCGAVGVDTGFGAGAAVAGVAVGVACGASDIATAGALSADGAGGAASTGAASTGTAPAGDIGDVLGERLSPVLQKTLKPGARIVSHRFLLGDWAPTKTVTVKGDDGAEYELHLWVVGEPKKKTDKKVEAK